MKHRQSQVRTWTGSAATQGKPHGGGEMLNLIHLRVAVHVAACGSVSRTAMELFRAQSAITRSIQELERELGVSLFERSASGMALSAAGEVVRQRANRVFDELATLARWCATRQARTRWTQAHGVPSYLLNTRRLHILVALARHRHMPTAAAAFGISQPAVSHAIRTLENGADLRLFERGARSVRLSAEGETFLLHVRRALNELRHIPDDLAAFEGSVRGQVTVGALPLGRSLILPEAIARISDTYPGIRIVTDESAYETLVAGLRAGDVDLILGALRPADPASGLVSERLMSEPMVVLARAAHPLSRLGPLRLAQLQDARWILPRPHAPARLLFDRLFTRERLRPPAPAVESADLALIRGLLLKTDMIAALSARQLHHEIEAGELVTLDVPLPDSSRDIGLTLRAASEPSPAALRLLATVREVVHDLGAGKAHDDSVV